MDLARIGIARGTAGAGASGRVAVSASSDIAGRVVRAFYPLA